ncbi:MAG TPA: DNA-binding transcriptional regulator Fis [Gammaproteobacteria bacterium]|jgi:Fis family transcriptional regulator|nr:DNA-binding transcriptional regulator Fis [Gammaproteobacteria bacterium]
MTSRTATQRVLEVVDGDRVGTSHSLRDYAEKTLRRYFSDLDGHDPSELYEFVLGEIEPPLLRTLMDYTRGNQSRAAAILGLNRSTLRKKLRQYKINT